MKRLVINALDFLVRAIDEFQEFPKYSIIHFSAAVEQFLKARLMAEHWTLVVSVRQRADWNNFISGNFQSVTLDEAASILEKVVLSELPKNALAAFRTIAKHVTAQFISSIRRILMSRPKTSYAKSQKNS